MRGARLANVALALAAAALLSASAPPLQRLQPFELAPARGFAPLKVTFTAPQALGAAAVEPRWNPGDGSPEQNGPVVVHRYVRPGVYTVTLTQGPVRAQRVLRVLGFSDPASQTVGDHPVALTAADFDEDGILDLVAANELDDSLTLLPSQGQPLRIPVGRFPLSLASADWNGDGHADLAVAHTGGNDVWLLLGTGDGGFSRIVEVPVGPRPTSVVAGDWNADGFSDLAVAYELDRVVTYLGDGTGRLLPAVTRTLPQGPVTLATTDLNRDGFADLLTANRDSNTVSALYADGAGGFIRQREVDVGLRPKSLAVGDFDEDGWPDVAVANWIENSVSVLENAHGVLRARLALRALAGPFAVVSGDLNGDGHLDLVVANLEGKALGVYLGDGNGAFDTPAHLGVPDQPVGLAVFDANGDGVPDIGVTGLTDDVFSLLINALVPQSAPADAD